MKSRFSPSPTGKLHIGSIRTALTSYILAKQASGQFILRIEDTDAVRSHVQWEQEIYETFDWMGIKSDGAIVRQTENHKHGVYKAIADKLVNSGFAYYCQCTTDDLKRMKANQLHNKSPRIGYTSYCRSKGHTSGVLRLNAKAISETFGMARVPITDKVVGDRNVDYRDVLDVVLLRADGTPTYILANTVDDVLAGVTHVTRGFDLFPQTATQVMIYRAVQAVSNLPLVHPQYAHLPLITGEKREKLSKRNTDTKSILDYKADGLLPDAIIQFAMSLGNSSVPLDRAVSVGELIELFDISKSRSSNTSFLHHTLIYVNRMHIRASDNQRLADIMLQEYGLSVSTEIIELFKYRADTLVELADSIKFTIEALKSNMDDLRKLAMDNFAPQVCQEFRSKVLQGKPTPQLDVLARLVG